MNFPEKPQACLSLACELLVYFTRPSRLRIWRPLWIGFPVGFVGTLGVYYTLLASV